MSNVHPFIKPPPKPETCSFCGRPKSEVPGELPIGPEGYGARICADCAKHAHKRCVEESSHARV